MGIAAGIAVVGWFIIWAVVMPGRLAPPVPTETLNEITDPRARLEVTDARTRLRHDLRTGALQLLTVLAVLAGAAAAGGFSCVELASAAPIQVPTIDRLAIRVLMDQQHDQFLRGSTVNGVVHEGPRSGPQRRLIRSCRAIRPCPARSMFQRMMGWMARLRS